jgi:hypothetical protein
MHTTWLPHCLVAACLPWLSNIRSRLPLFPLLHEIHVGIVDHERRIGLAEILPSKVSHLLWPSFTPSFYALGTYTNARTIENTSLNASFHNDSLPSTSTPTSSRVSKRVASTASSSEIHQSIASTKNDVGNE